MGDQPPQPRKRVHNGEWMGPPPKRNVPTVSSLQRELQHEKERHRRSQESVEQLRLEMQMMGRVFAAAREQIVALGGASLSPEVALAALPSDAIRARKSEAKALQRVQTELSESRAEVKRLNDQVKFLRQKLQLVLFSKQELSSLVSDMQEYLNSAWP